MMLMSFAVASESIFSSMEVSNTSEGSGNLLSTVLNTLSPSVLIPSYEPTMISKFSRMCLI